MKRRDITLGEMQDECKRVDRKCEKCDRRISGVCGSMVNSNGYFETPKYWDLTDTPRFNEAQMALLKAMWEIGARFITRDKVDVAMFERKPVYDKHYEEYFVDENAGDNDASWVFPVGLFDIGLNEIIDLAELLGKDGDK